MTEQLIADPRQWRAALARAARLVRAGDVDAAQAQADAMARWQPPDAPYEESVAEAFEQAAMAAGACGEAAAFEWLWKRAFDYWHFWGACATSGGEGTARARVISRAQGRYRQALHQLATRLRGDADG